MIIGKRLVQSDRAHSTGETETSCGMPALRASFSVDSTSSMKGMKSAKSLRQMALRNHSRQSNSYLSTKDLLASSGLLFSHVSGENIIASSSSSKASKQSTREEPPEVDTLDLQNSESHGPVIKKSPSRRSESARTQIGTENKIQDDVDWIQVDDDDGEDEDERV